MRTVSKGRASTALGLGVAAALFASAATMPALALELVDQRQTQPHAESKNVGTGALLTIGDWRLGRSLAERLADRIRTASPLGADGQRLTVDEGQLTLFIEDAFAMPGVASQSSAVREISNRQWPDEVSEVRVYSRLGVRRYRAVLRGDLDGKAFTAESVVEFRGDNADALKRRQAIDAVLDDAMRQIATSPAS